MPKTPHTILVVDDDAQALRLVSEALRKHGYTVFAATRSVQALEHLESRAGADVKLVIIDLVMPDIDGMELATRINLLRADLKILVISGYADDVIVHNDFNTKNIDFLSKPFNMRDLYKRIDLFMA